jgi:putative transcriptional regulator
MTIKELRMKTGMTQKAFAEYFNIPVRTIQDWESERRTPPEYVVELIEYKIKKEDLMMKLVELNEGNRREIVSGSLEEIVTYLKKNPDIYEWINERELETEALMGKDRYEPSLVSLNLDNIETLRDLENEIEKLDLGWWTLVIE